MPFIFLPVLIFVEELVQVAVTAAVIGAGVAVGAQAGEVVTNSINNLSTSSTHSTLTLEQKTIYDWWCNGLDSEERQILLEHGYSDGSGCFRLEELKSTSERMFVEKAPGKPTENDGFKPDKKQGDRLVKNPNGQGKGWLDKNGEVWVPTGNDGHGGAHWDVQNPRTGGHRDVSPWGRTRYH